TDKTRTFEVSNTGEFEWSFRASAAPLDEETPRLTTARPKTGTFALRSEGKVAGDTLTVGPFTISPCNAKTVTVKFGAPAHAASFLETLLVEIFERDPMDQPRGYRYELTGEACIPGINTQARGWAEIFEEQAVVREMTLGADRNVFATDSRMFSFGAALVGAEVRIYNPIKVTARVNIAIRPYGSAAGVPLMATPVDAKDIKGKTATAVKVGKEVPVEAVPSFDVEPKQL
ncbi:hypothetical protein T492DRAFT_884734, partial [Pavlovales sp. CCMP2436]